MGARQAGITCAVGEEPMRSLGAGGGERRFNCSNAAIDERRRPCRRTRSGGMRPEGG